MPPLLLTDDEAVAMAIGLRITASQQLITEVDATITALTKLERMLPARLRALPALRVLRWRHHWLWMSMPLPCAVSPSSPCRCQW